MAKNYRNTHPKMPMMAKKLLPNEEKSIWKSFPCTRRTSPFTRKGFPFTRKSFPCSLLPNRDKIRLYRLDFGVIALKDIIIYFFLIRKKAVTLRRKPWILVRCCVVALDKDVVGLVGTGAWEAEDDASFSKETE